MAMWGVLTRVGGSEEDSAVPKTIQLSDKECFFGRFPVPAAHQAHFTHKSQILLDCAYVSSTHFSIRCEKDAAGVRSHLLTDHSRNGTYLDRALVGTNKTVSLPDNGEISLMYKNKTRVAYKFTSVDSGLVPLKVEKAEEAAELNGAEDSVRMASAKSQAETVAETLARQIAVLQEEGKSLEQRFQQQVARIEADAQERERTNAKMAALEKGAAALQEEKADLTERLATAESHAAAVEARSLKLQEQLDEAKTEAKELKVKTAHLTEEVQSKTAQLNSRNSLMVDSSKTLAHEQKQWEKLQAKYERAKADLSSAREQNVRFTAVNQALQAVVSDQESSLVNLRKQNEQLLDIVAAGRAAVIERETAVAEVHRMFAQAAAMLTTAEQKSAQMLAQADYFEAIAAPAAELKWVGSQVNGNHDTYVEAYPPSARFYTPSEALLGAAEADPGAVQRSPSVTPGSRSAASSPERENGAKRKRSQATPEAESEQRAKVQATPTSVLQRTATTPAEAGAEDGGNEDGDEDMQRTQAQATFAHLFEDISQHSGSDDDGTRDGAEEDGDRTSASGTMQQGRSATEDNGHADNIGSHSASVPAPRESQQSAIRSPVKTVSPGGNPLVMQKIEAVRARAGESGVAHSEGTNGAGTSQTYRGSQGHLQEGSNPDLHKSDGGSSARLAEDAAAERAPMDVVEDLGVLVAEQPAVYTHQNGSQHQVIEVE
jgi:predicted  nucleic acid-binding Zn-ribbon protein